MSDDGVPQCSIGILCQYDHMDVRGYHGEIGVSHAWVGRVSHPTHMCSTSFTIASTPTRGARPRMGAATPAKQTTSSGATHPPPSYAHLQGALMATGFAKNRCGSRIITFSTALSGVSVGGGSGTWSACLAVLRALAVRARGCAGSLSTSWSKCTERNLKPPYPCVAFLQPNGQLCVPSSTATHLDCGYDLHSMSCQEATEATFSIGCLHPDLSGIHRFSCPFAIRTVLCFASMFLYVFSMFRVEFLCFSMIFYVYHKYLYVFLCLCYDFRASTL